MNLVPFVVQGRCVRVQAEGPVVLQRPILASQPQASIPTHVFESASPVVTQPGRNVLVYAFVRRGS